MAKIIYASLALGYFQPQITEQQTTLFAPKQSIIQEPTILFAPKETQVPTDNSVEDKTNDFSTREKLELLNKYIELTEDKTLKENLIREAAKLITGKDF